MGGSAGDQRRQQIRRELNCCLQLCTLRFGSRFHLPPPAVEFSSRRPGPGTTTITVSADVAPALRHTTPDTRHRSTIPTRVLLRSIPSGDLDTATYNWPALSRRHWHLCWRKPSTRLRHLVTRQATSYPGADGSIDCYCKTPQSSNTDPSLEQLQPIRRVESAKPPGTLSLFSRRAHIVRRQRAISRRIALLLVYADRLGRM